MKYDFQIISIKKSAIDYLFRLSEKELKERGIAKIKVDEKPGYPCRVSLKDAAIGEEVFAFSYEHHQVQSPYQSSGPVFVRANAVDAKLDKNEIPLMLNHRLLSLRVYDKHALMVDARTVEGKQLETEIQTIFANNRAMYIQVHNASPGCYNCQVNRLN